MYNVFFSGNIFSMSGNQNIHSDLFQFAFFLERKLNALKLQSQKRKKYNHLQKLPP